MYTLIRQSRDNRDEHTEEIKIYLPLIKYQISSLKVLAFIEFQQNWLQNKNCDYLWLSLHELLVYSAGL